MKERILATRKSFAALDGGYQELLYACDRLDRLRFELGTEPDPAECSEVVEHLEKASSLVRHLEDLCLVPALKTEAPFSLFMERFLIRIGKEHCEDACFFEEVKETLGSYAIHDPILDPKATGYLLRSYTHLLRRHIYAERIIARVLASSISRGVDRVEPEQVAIWRFKEL